MAIVATVLRQFQSFYISVETALYSEHPSLQNLLPSLLPNNKTVDIFASSDSSMFLQEIRSKGSNSIQYVQV